MNLRINLNAKKNNFMNASFKDGEQKQSVGALPIILGLGGIGVLSYFAFDFFDKERSRKATDEANKNIATSTANQIRTQQRIATIESKAIFSGKNGWGKETTVNITDQAKELIDALLNTYTEVNSGIKKYNLKTQTQLSGEKALNTLFDTPVNKLNRLKLVYTAYTQRNLTEDLQKLPANTYAKIKALLNVAAKTKQT